MITRADKRRSDLFWRGVNRNLQRVVQKHKNDEAMANAGIARINELYAQLKAR